MSGLAEALAEHEPFWPPRGSRCCTCGESYTDVPENVSAWTAHSAHLADVAHRWYAERLGSDDVAEAVRLRLSELFGTVEDHATVRTALRIAATEALTERGDRG